MPPTFYPPGPNPAVGGCCESMALPSSFVFADLTNGTIVINYAGIQTPPDLTLLDPTGQKIDPVGVTDLTPGQTSGQLILDLGNLNFSGRYKLKIS